jgi:hypothetical protein
MELPVRFVVWEYVSFARHNSTDRSSALASDADVQYAIPNVNNEPEA